MPKEKSAGAIIFRQEGGVKYYLLLHYPSMSRKGGHWEFTKGHVEGQESEEQTMRREVAEETDLKDLRIIPGFKKYIKYFFRSYRDKSGIRNSGEALKNDAPRQKGKSGWIFKLVIFFLAETKTKEIKISSEHLGYLWLPIDQAIKKTTFKNSKKLLKEADDFIAKNSSI